ncbi:precorrin-2 dehydrogenase/sirohydrochlorin ferrochelatase family protein [Persephonella sp.]
MALFPMFIDLTGKKVLIVGAGNVALRKIEKLIPFSPDITVVAKKVSDDVRDICSSNGIEVFERPFRIEDLEGKDMVIVAVDDIQLQKEIFEYCRDLKIPVNSVDSPEYCDFIFPAYVKIDDIVIGITTSGKAPGLSAKIREIIENCLPDNLEDLLNELSHIREKEKKGKERQELIKKIIRDKLG